MVVVVAREVEKRKSNPTYADLMLRVNGMGWNTFTREHLEKQESLLRQALALEPDKPRAMLGLAVTLTNLIGFEHITRGKRQRESLDRGSRLGVEGQEDSSRQLDDLCRPLFIRPQPW